MTLKECLHCGQLYEGKPCCSRPERSTAERRRRKEAVTWHILESGGLWCPGWGSRKRHLVEFRSDLCADHIEPVANGGSEDGPLQVLCRPCNSAKKNRIVEE